MAEQIASFAPAGARHYRVSRGRSQQFLLEHPQIFVRQAHRFPPGREQRGLQERVVHPLNSIVQCTTVKEAGNLDSTAVRLGMAARPRKMAARRRALPHLRLRPTRHAGSMPGMRDARDAHCPDCWRREAEIASGNGHSRPALAVGASGQFSFPAVWVAAARVADGAGGGGEMDGDTQRRDGSLWWQSSAAV